MCGRTACVLAPDQLCKAYSGKETRRYQGAAKWRDVPGNVDSYKPRYNLGPSVYNPILVSGHHFAKNGEKEKDNESDEETENESFEEGDLVIQPMLWGLVPSYHKGEPKEFRYKTINARVEGLTEKQTFRAPLNKGRRCVVLADGFYEWKRGPKEKQPYFIYFPQQKNIQWDHPENDNGGDTWTGRRPLTMAGIFEINDNAEYPLFTYTIITVPASKNLSWMHDRMPALLDGDEAVDKWLDSEKVPLEEALELLKPVNNVAYHAVTASMGNIRTQGPECILPMEETKKADGGEQKSGNTLLQYFKPKRQAQAKDETTSEQEDSDEDDNGQGPSPKTRKM